MPESGPRARYVLIFDGGSRGNPGPSYGSFRIERVGGGRGRPERRTFRRGTNNEAEYQALIAGLRALLDKLAADGLAPAQVALEVRGDSQLVIRQLDGEWKVKAAGLRDLRDQADDLLARFGSVRLRHQPRARSVAVLGH